ncbi:hypothetical protein COO91_08181 [Nostoc flagelliforme CCNUN1]|uniref:Uncharacterized protein n=1 Tax=Nostoc flagelliforme CCNUN1 TaxID=2038116 RepID=A0A2K8T2Y5_9NOSO|nr:hypothetical protein [Nostoc flagelliforme]AUB42078.1 hypothetical protein COO91_08181 [Nostoc flagelliforme CCNUN1]
MQGLKRGIINKSTSVNSRYEAGAMRFCDVFKIRVLNHLFRGAIAAK